MHRFSLPSSLVERVSAIRGKAHVFDVLDPKTTALLVIDLQNYFMAPGQQCEVPMARQIVPSVNRLARGLRAAGGRVIWIRNGTDDARDWTVMHERLMVPARRDIRYLAMDKDGYGRQLWSLLDVLPGDWHVTKTRFSAFIAGSSTLDTLLRAKGITSLLISGTTTDVCCESTARDAMMLNYEVVMVSDANAAFTDEIHAAALHAFYANFGDVLTVDESLAALAADRSVPVQKPAMVV
jgi:ureidoacrylate peracid hydrolase